MMSKEDATRINFLETMKANLEGLKIGSKENQLSRIEDKIRDCDDEIAEIKKKYE